MPRYDRVPGLGRVRCYVQRPRRTADCWLVLFEDRPTYDERADRESDRPRPYGPRFALYASDHPAHPQGVGGTDYIAPPLTYGRGADHRRVPFADLPPDVRRAVLDMADDLADLEAAPIA